jgi:hypothetical protein
MPCVRIILPLVAALAIVGCAVHDDATQVFVRDPHQVWVEAWTSSGTRVLLPVGHRISQVTVHADLPPDPEEPTYATVAREPSGGITLDYPACAPWPLIALNAKGELVVVREHGEEKLLSDGHNLRVPFRCGDEHFTSLDLAFVTPLSNVREVHIVHDAQEPIAESSSDPALQRHAWVP